MKLVQLLAKKLKEWPKGVDVYAQDANGQIYPWIGIPQLYEEEWLCAVGATIHQGDSWFGREGMTLCEDHMTANVTKSQWQAEREKMNKPKWIRHRGGKCPVADGVDVTYRLRGGYVGTVKSESLMWDHQQDESDLMAYYIEETKEQEVEKVKVADVKLEMMQGDSWVTIGRVSPDFGASVFDGGQPAKSEEMDTIDTAKAPTIEYAFGDKDSDPKDLDWKQLGTITYKLEIDATEATKEIDSLVAKWGQIESPLKWRDEIIELEAYEEEFRREREKLIRKLESEGFKLIDHMVPVYGDTLVDMDNWENWENGDVIEVINESKSSNAKPGLYMITGFESSHPKIELGGRYFPEYANMKFVRRP